MHVEFLVEEPSAEAVLTNIVPKIDGEGLSFRIHAYQGKSDLLNKLLPRLRGYKPWLPEDWRIVVLVDADDEDCRELKGNLEEKARDAGFLTKSSRPIGSIFQVLSRLAIEELEAWFFGDVEALNAAYPRISLNLRKKARYRDPDAIKDGTWEALEREKDVRKLKNKLLKFEGVRFDQKNIFHKKKERYITLDGSLPSFFNPGDD